jgi:hypothetical protein
MVAMKPPLERFQVHISRNRIAQGGCIAGLFALSLLVMIVDGAGRASGHRTDRRTGSTSGYGSYRRATGGSHGDTSNGSANVMVTTINGPVIARVLSGVRRVRRSDRDNTHH